LSRTHEEQRLLAGEKALRRFFAFEGAEPWSPTAVEQDFAFYVDRNKVVGRYDLVLEENGHVTVVDFKTGDVQTEKKAALRSRESLQLDVYALAWLRTKGRLPDRVELRFLESGLAAGRVPSRDDVEGTEARIRAAASGIRRREFPARPTYAACGQCPFREICPHTASAAGAEA
jgi:RecB family exonuclease